MSRVQSTRRLSLLAGASLVAAGLSAGAVLTPGAAFAQATCAAVPAPAGNGSNAVTIAAGTYNPGISCVYVGETAAVTTAGAITVGSTAPANPALNGVNLTATGSDDIIWTSTAGTVTGGAQTNGPVIEALTESGDIDITAATVTATAATITDGIRAVSSLGGNVSVTVSNPTAVSSVLATNATTGDAAIEAVSMGGNGNVTVTTGNASFTAVTNGRLYGIQARASGSGNLTLNVGIAGANTASSIAGIDATTGTGLLTINAGAVGQINNNAHVLRFNTGGNAVVSMGSASGGVNATKARIDMTTVAGTLSSIDVAGGIGGGHGSNGGGNDAALTQLALAGRGGGHIAVTAGRLIGVVDFSALTGGAELTVAGLWDTRAVSRFGTGDDLVTTPGGGTLVARGPAEIMFGAGDDTYANAGVVNVAPTTAAQGYLVFTGLEQFDNSGRITMGSRALAGQTGSNSEVVGPLDTDSNLDDVLLMPGATFTGSGDSLIVMDVDYSGVGQTACDVALRHATTGAMPAADCIGIQGGATSGVTKLLIHDQITGDRGVINSIVLVDVSGGTSEAGHFVLDERSTGYTADNGGTIDKRVLTYALVYDADTQQHMLVSTPGGNALQFALLPSVAQSLWRTSTGSWFDRQADLRGDVPEGVGGGVWLRVNGEIASRDVLQTIVAASATLEYDGSFEQKAYAVTGGFDLFSGGGADSAWGAGVMAGYANAKVEYDATLNTASYDGFTVGAYASLLSGGLFVDAAVNANRLVLKEDIPTLQLFPAGTILDTDLISVGAQVEAGWRFAVMDGAFVEPLASVSYVKTRYDALDIPSDDPARPRIGLEFDDPTSLRAGLGGRVGLEQDYGGVRAQYSLLAKTWNEFEGENTVALVTAGGDAIMVDDFGGRFNEVVLGASLYSAGGVVSGFLNLGGKYGDDYEAKTGSVGVRVNW